MNIHSEPPTLDPRKASDATSVSIIKMCFEGLVREGKEGKIVPALAQKIDISSDGKVFTFHLRDALWSDGTPITASDFEKSFKASLDPHFPSERAYDLYPIKNAKQAKEGKAALRDVGVKALDEKTLLLELENPLPHFLQLLTSHAFFPTPSHLDEVLVSSGPFKLKKWLHYNEIVLEKNPLYWDHDAVKLEEIHLPIIEDENTELSLFERGDLDWAGSPLSALPLDPLPTLFREKRVHSFPYSGVYFFIFNTKEFPFQNVKLRRALALALDRKSIVENITQGKQMPAMGIIPPTMWKKSTPHFADHALGDARLLFQEGMKELHLTKENFPTISLSYNTASSHHKIAQAVQQQWKEAFGIEVRLENKEWKVFLSELLHHNFQIARLGGVASINDPADFLENYRYAHSHRNYSQWGHHKFSELLSKAEKTKEAKKRMEYLLEAEKILMQEMPVIPLYFYTGHYMKNPKVKNVFITETGEIDLKTAYIE